MKPGHADVERILDTLLADVATDDDALAAFVKAIEADFVPGAPAWLAGRQVTVSSVTYYGNVRRGLVAAVSDRGRPHEVALYDLEFAGGVAWSTAHAAYRLWVDRGARMGWEWTAGRWRYRTLGSRIARTTAAAVEEPLAMENVGIWDPDCEFGRHPGEPVEPAIGTVLAAGPRRKWRMQRLDPPDQSLDPGTAVSSHKGVVLARVLLRELIDREPRCLDAYAHLGAILAESDVDAALHTFDLGVAVGERSLPVVFDGVLPYDIVENRPFLQCLWGLGRILWRLGRYEQAKGVMESLLWLDPADEFRASRALDAVALGLPPDDAVARRQEG